MRHGSGARGFLFTTALTTLALLTLVPVASAEVPFCTNGSGAGQCLRPEGVAVDNTTGRVFVIDREANRISIFDQSGVFQMAFGWGVADGSTEALQSCGPAANPPTSSCFKGIAGAGPGQFDVPWTIAVDNSGGSGQGDVYVGADNYRIQKFDSDGEFLLAFGAEVNKTKVAEGAPEQARNLCVAGSGDVCGGGIRGTGTGQFGQSDDPIAVGPDGIVYVGDVRFVPSTTPARIMKFTPAGTFLETLPLSQVRAIAIAVDSHGDIYYYSGYANTGIRKLSPSGSEYGDPYPLDPRQQTNVLGVDEFDTLFAGQRETPPGSPMVTVYSPSGEHIGRFGYRAGSNLGGIAPFHNVAGDVFFSQRSGGGEENGAVWQLRVPPPEPIIVPFTVSASPVGNVRATLRAEVNPEGLATEYSFEYLDQESFDEDGGFAGPNSKKVGPLPLDGEGFELLEAAVEIGCPDPANEAELEDSSCLLPATGYHYRVFAENAAGDDEVTGTFTTKPPLEILDAWSSGVGIDRATLSVEVNPLGVPTMGYFQYVDDAGYRRGIEEAEERGDPEPATHGFDHAKRAPATGELDFGLSEAPVVRTASPFSLESGTTYHFRLLASDPLLAEPVIGPERAFTTFKAPELPDADCQANEAFRAGSSAFLPDCRAYEMVSPLEKNNGDIVALRNEAFLPAALEQSSTSGEKLAYSSFRAFGDARSAGYTAQYIASREAGVGWQSHGVSPPRGTLVIPAGRAADIELRAFSPDLCQGWVRTVADPPLAPGAVRGFSNLYLRQDQLCGGESFDALTTAEPPNVKASEYRQLELHGASADGEHTIYVAPDNLAAGASPQPAPCVSQGLECQLRLYEHVAGEGVRLVCVPPSGGPSVQGCSAGTATVGGGATVHNAISADGSRIFWTDASRPDGRGPGQIYARIDGIETVAVSKGGETISGSVQSRYWTAADDGSKVIFTTGGDLYEFDVDGKTTNPIAHKVAGVLGASEDAARIYFVSEEILSGANAEDRSPSAKKPNLYLYRALSDTYTFIGTLSSADANPEPLNGEASPISTQPYKHTARVTPDGSHAAFMSSARLTGYDSTDVNSGKTNSEVFLYDAGSEQLVCASCNPTGSRPVGVNLGEGNEFWTAARIPGWETDLYAARVLSTDGQRLFLESTDVLSPRDTNGRKDVYQWEAVGKGDCDAGSSAFSAANGGCISLISSGKSDRDSEFRDASPSGDDVFIATLSSLVSQDYGLVDIYDARIDGGLPSPPPPRRPCEGDACQNPPAPPAVTTLSSSVFQGPGNSKQAARKRTCAKNKMRRKGRCVRRKSRGQKHHRQRKHHKYRRAAR